MDDTKQNKPVYAHEPAKTTPIGIAPEATKTAETPATEKAAPLPKQTQELPMTALPEMARTGGYASLAQFVEFLKRTWREWLIVAAAFFGLMAVVALVERASEWARNAREKRHEEAIATVTPERLIARCGQPAEDVTREVYPILMRTMSYQPGENEKFVFAFSRTAEENSDWVFLSMKDESGARSYDTPETKIAALPCLDSKK
ncbi:MAG TPA: hypothetical protein VH110_10410 [Candidatus Acidoferrum sp.]|jgi:hypothetical protein|nr:hypothetical protein [Candidatus Acidoferrum sp.]